MSRKDRNPRTRTTRVPPTTAANDVGGRQAKRVVERRVSEFMDEVLDPEPPSAIARGVSLKRYPRMAEDQFDRQLVDRPVSEVELDAGTQEEFRARRRALDPPTEPKAVAARQDPAETKLDAYIRRVVAAAPTLSPDRIDRLQALFGGAPAEQPSEPSRLGRVGDGGRG